MPLAMTRNTPSFVAALAAAVAAVAAPPAAAGAGLSSMEHAVIRQVNDARSAHGLASLRASTALSRAADHHSRDMLRSDFFHHSSADGTSFGTRVRRYCHARMVGETLAAIGWRRGGATLVVRLWMESPPHRAVLLDPGFRRIGIARRWGMLGGAGRAVVTADLASAR